MLEEGHLVINFWILFELVQFIQSSIYHHLKRFIYFFILESGRTRAGVNDDFL